VTKNNYIVNALVAAVSESASHVAFQDDIATTYAILYLIDWKMSLEHGCQVTSLKWHRGHMGPCAQLETEPARVQKNSLDDKERKVVEHVCNTFLSLDPLDFLHTVLGTYPLLMSDLYGELHLPSLASDYKEQCP
jgi:hypothetical protein